MTSERGSVLFLALLVTLVLMGLVLLEVERTMVEVRMVGNTRFSKVAQYITDGGLTATLAKAATSPTSFLDFAAAKNFKIKYADLGIEIHDINNPSNSFGPEGNVATIVDFTTELTNPADTNRVPGFSSTDACFRRYTWTTTGQYGIPGSTTNPNQAVSQSFRLSTHKVRTIGYIGPIPCAL